MAVKRLYLIPNGFLMLNQSILTSGIGYSEEIKIPVYSVLLDTDDGLFLVDTGLNPDGLLKPELAWGERAKIVKPIMKEQDDIRVGLGVLGYSIADIQAVINTHLHWDHTGGNRFFSHCPIYVQKAEFRFALYPDHHHMKAYMENHFKHPLNYSLVEGDLSLVDGITILFTPGHTPGHQSVLIELPESGLFILSGDAIYCYENLDGPIPQGNCWDIYQSLQSINKVKMLYDKFKCTILHGHEPTFWDHFRVAPYSYL